MEVPIIYRSKLLLFFLASSAYAHDFYVRADIGGVLLGDFTANIHQPDLQINTLGRSWLYGGGIGTFLTEDFRLEAKVVKRSWMRYQYFSESVATIDLTVGKLQNTTATLGLYYELFHLKRARPYVGVGGGYSYNRLYDNQRLTDLDAATAVRLPNSHQNSACFFLSTGTWIDLGCDWKIDLAATYFHLGTVPSVSSTQTKISNIGVFEFSLGLIYLCF